MLDITLKYKAWSSKHLFNSINNYHTNKEIFIDEMVLCILWHIMVDTISSLLPICSRLMTNDSERNIYLVMILMDRYWLLRKLCWARHRSISCAFQAVISGVWPHECHVNTTSELGCKFHEVKDYLYFARNLFSETNM